MFRAVRVTKENIKLQKGGGVKEGVVETGTIKKRAQPPKDD